MVFDLEKRLVAKLPKKKKKILRRVADETVISEFNVDLHHCGQSRVPGIVPCDKQLD